MSVFNEHHRLEVAISENVQENIALMDGLFDKCGDIVKKEFVLQRKQGELRIYMVYIDGMVNTDQVAGMVLRPLLYEWREEEEYRPFRAFLQEEIESVDVKAVDKMDDALAGILKGDTAIFVDREVEALVVSTKRFPVRGIDEAKSEQGIRGARDGFIESIRTNTALLRRRIKDPNLKMEQGILGQRSRTDYALCYMDGLVDEQLVKHVKMRLAAFEVDGVFDSGTLEHLMEKKWYSPFPVCQSTARPDKAASALLEGRVVLIVDNSPEALVLPVTFPMFFQAADDYFNRWWVASFGRVLRFVAALLAIGLPGFYVAVTSFHTEVLPTKLMLAISAARTAVTFPVLIEILLMELLFELLREAGIRLPGAMGNTIGVVGGLIVGQSAVEAHLVSTIVVIVVALSAISAFCIPNEEFASAFRLLKFFLIVLSGIWGFYGFLMGMLVIALHLSNLSSFGVPYMLPAVGGDEGDYNHLKDYILRLPSSVMYKRPIFTKDGERIRLRWK